MISLIAAVDKNFGIGSGGRPLWKNGLPADSQHFRRLTAGSTVVMGRKAFQSFHGVLPGRQNIVVTHRFEVRDDVIFARGLDEAFAAAKHNDVNVVGGASIFAQAIDVADRIYLTMVDQEFDGVDAYFPVIDRLRWREVRREDFQAGAGNIFNYSYITYQRIK